MSRARDNANNWAADITAVSAGVGVTGGGTSGAVTVTNDMATTIDAKGDLLVGTADNAYDNLGVGTSNQTLLVDSATTTGLKWAASPQSLMTTTGDILYASGANTPARLGVGSTGQYLTVSGGVPAWGSVSAGGLTLIQEVVANADSGISFSSISSSYKQLLLMWGGVQHSGSGSQFRLRINNDSGSNYNWCSMTYSNAAGANGNVGTNISVDAAFGEQAYNTELYQVNFGYFLLDNYASTSKAKTYNYSFGYRNAVNGQNQREAGNGVWNSTSAVTSLDIVRTVGTATISNQTNTTIRLYGVA